MKRLATVALLAWVAMTAPVRGAAPDCIPNEKCAEGISPPACCSPPPCQIYEYLKQMRALQRVTSSDRAAKALRQSHGNHSQAIASLNAAFANESGALKSASQDKCRFEGPYSSPNFRVAQCQLQVQKPSGWSPVEGALSLLDDFKQCNELIEGEFARWNHIQESCIPGAAANVKTWAARIRNSAQDSIDATVGHLQTYYHVCSTKLREDEEALRQLEEVPEVEMDKPSQSVQDALRTLQQKSAPKPKPSAPRKPPGVTR